LDIGRSEEVIMKIEGIQEEMAKELNLR